MILAQKILLIKINLVDLLLYFFLKFFSLPSYLLKIFYSLRMISSNKKNFGDIWGLCPFFLIGKMHFDKVRNVERYSLIETPGTL